MTPFCYRLAPLLRFQESSLPSLREVLVAAQSRQAREQAALNAIASDIAGCESALAALPANTSIFLSALGFVRELHEQRRVQLTVLEEAESQVLRASEAVNEARARVRQLEKHRERQRLAHQGQEQKREYRELDESWMRRNRNEGMHEHFIA